MIALSGAFVLQGAAAQESGNDSAADETDDASGVFEVASLTAPESAAPGSTVDVAAEVENPSNPRCPNSWSSGSPVRSSITASVTVQPGESTVVHLSADTEGLEPGQYYHAVFTDEDGQVEQITLSESFDLESADAP